MIPRLGDGNVSIPVPKLIIFTGLENDSPSRGRKLDTIVPGLDGWSLENDSPSRGRKPIHSDWWALA